MKIPLFRIEALESRCLLNGGSGNLELQAVPVEMIVAAGHLTLSQPRAEIAVGTAGNKVYFAGGNTGNFNSWESDVVDIYEVSTGQMSTSHLSQGRSVFSVAGAGDKVMVAGGFFGNQVDARTILDVYDAHTGQWSTESILPRYFADAVELDDQLLFVGGSSADRAYWDASLYDAKSEQWTTMKTALPNTVGPPVRVGRHVIVKADGGWDVYDIVQQVWFNLPTLDNGILLGSVGMEVFVLSQQNLVKAINLWTGNWREVGQLQFNHAFGQQGYEGRALLGTRLVFAGGFDQVNFDRTGEIEVLDLLSGEHQVLGGNLALSDIGITSYGSKLYKAGGNTDIYGRTSDVQIFEDASPVALVDGYFIRGRKTSKTVQLTVRNTGDAPWSSGSEIRIYGHRAGKKAILLGQATTAQALETRTSLALSVHLNLPARTTLRQFALTAHSPDVATSGLIAGEIRFPQFTGQVLAKQPHSNAGLPIEFTVAYKSDYPFDVGSLDDQDVVVISEKHDVFHAMMTGYGPGKHGDTLIVKYGFEALPGPAVGFNSSHNGIWEVHLQENQVLDLFGNAATAEIIGQLLIQLRVV